MGVSTSLDTNGIWECPLPTDCGHSGQVLYKGMSEFLYSAWFVDENALPNDQDREWVACILIDADCADAAKSWGDSLAHDRAAKSLSECFLWSSIEDTTSVPEPTDLLSLPRIKAGQLASDRKSAV